MACIRTPCKPLQATCWFIVSHIKSATRMLWPKIENPIETHPIFEQSNGKYVFTAQKLWEFSSGKPEIPHNFI